jgi:hypothetical protein
MTTGCGNSLLSSLLTAAQSFSPQMPRLYTEPMGFMRMQGYLEMADLGGFFSPRKQKIPGFSENFPCRIRLTMVE